MNRFLKISKKIIILSFIFFIMPFFVDALEENCYGDHALDVKKKDFFKLANGFCIYPEEIDYPAPNYEAKNFPFLGYGVYEWDVFGQNYNKNVSIISDLKNCGEADHPCYCDNSLKPENPYFDIYCCPSLSGLCNRDSNLIYENRPFLTVYRNNGDLDIKGNLAVSGKSSFFLRETSLIGFFNSKINDLYLTLKSKFHDVLARGKIFINNNLILNRKHGSIEFNQESQISKVKRNKIIRTNLQGKEQGAGWKEFNTHELLGFNFENLTSIASNNDHYYFVDNGNKRVIKTAKDNSYAVFVGNDDWAWRPVGIDVDDSDFLYITSSYDEYSEIDNSFFRITSPSADTVYKVGDKVVVSWSKIPKADDYKVHYKFNNEDFKTVDLRSGENSFEIEASNDMIGIYEMTISASVDNKKIFTNNNLTFSISSDVSDMFRITSPRHSSEASNLSEYPSYNLDYFSGDKIFFSWDKYDNAKEYRLVYYLDSGSEQELYSTTATSIELNAGQGALVPGNYRVKVRAYRDGVLLKESINEKKFSIYEKRQDIKSLSDNIFSFRIEGNNSSEAEIKGWKKFMPDPDNFDEIRNYNILKEYYEFANKDPEALYFKDPKGIKQSGGYLYIVDSGNNRVVRLSENIKIPGSLAESLKTIKNNFVKTASNKDWQNDVSTSLRDQLNEYWQVVYGKGSISKDFVNNIDNQYTPLGELSNPYGIFVDSNGLYIVDSGNKRIVFQDIYINAELENWHQLAFADWTPLNMIKSGQYFYITDVENGSVVRIDMSRGVGSEHSYFSKGAVFNDSYFIFGMRGQEDYNFSFPVDLTYVSGSFNVVDGVSDTGYAFLSGPIATTSVSSLVNLYSGESTRTLSSYPKNPYNNEFNADARIDKIKIDDSVSLFNNQQDELRQWTKGPAISHCKETCSQGYTEKTQADDCEIPHVNEWSYTCNNCWEDTVILDDEGENLCISGCTDQSYDSSCARTCRGQWDWHANAPSCTKYIIEWNITAHTDDSCKMCPSTCYRDVCDENGENCYEESYDCEVPCGTTYTADPECVPFEYDCRAGYAVGFNEYTYMPYPDGYSKYPYLEQKVGSSENMNYSLKDGWPDWVY
jgi:hypothetical protein